MKNMPHPFALTNPLVLLDPCWHPYLAKTHRAPVECVHDKLPDVTHWATTYQAHLTTFMQHELSSERDSAKPGAHLPLHQRLQDVYALQHTLAILVKSSDDPEMGTNNQVYLLKQALVSLLGRKKNFPDKILPSAENNTMTPPWYYRLKDKGHSEKRERELEDK